jgi:hypothetical protein
VDTYQGIPISALRASTLTPLLELLEDRLWHTDETTIPLQGTVESAVPAVSADQNVV